MVYDKDGEQVERLPTNLGGFLSGFCSQEAIECCFTCVHTRFKASLSARDGLLVMKARWLLQSCRSERLKARAVEPTIVTVAITKRAQYFGITMVMFLIIAKYLVISTFADRPFAA